MDQTTWPWKYNEAHKFHGTPAYAKSLVIQSIVPQKNCYINICSIHAPILAMVTRGITWKKTNV